MSGGGMHSRGAVLRSALRISGTATALHVAVAKKVRAVNMDTAIYMVPAAWVVSSLPLMVRGVLVSRFGNMDNRTPRDRGAQTAGMPKHIAALCDRLLACHNNQLETLGWFSAGVATAVAASVEPQQLAALASGYVAGRLAYTLAYAAPQLMGGVARSLAFVGSMSYVLRIYLAAASAVKREW
eukprot:TRINITY_DN2477_c0_g1_i1.p2 TRINITY_DN2477_c0_g1~~TRINITY_DN2477_c0_g1_i1.p2  ORF type:complete len:183 (-),score=42.53 TRINITY_DN2477_c0_g1_i1:301-849(-)